MWPTMVATVKEILARAKAVRAPQLVSAIALRSLLSFLPILLLAVGILGLVARGRLGSATTWSSGWG